MTVLTEDRAAAHALGKAYSQWIKHNGKIPFVGRRKMPGLTVFWEKRKKKYKLGLCPEAAVFIFKIMICLATRLFSFISSVPTLVDDIFSLTCSG